MTYLSLTSRDPLIARDGRPFGADQGRHMKSLDWPYPSVMAGSLRTLLGKLVGSGFDSDTVAKLKALEVAGPLPVAKNELFFPAPRDIVLRRDEGKNGANGGPIQFFLRRPFHLNRDEGCNLPEGLLPLGLSENPEEDFKPFRGPAFWSATNMEQWLKDSSGERFQPPPDVRDMGSQETMDKLVKTGFLRFPLKDQRTHVKIDPANLASEEGMLFSTTGLVMHHGVSMSVRVTGESDFSEILHCLPVLHPLGGERRLVHWTNTPAIETRWNCPKSLEQAFTGIPGVRMIMASPGLFEHGWKPGWIGSDLLGTPPGTGVQLRLRAASVDRWAPISGWGLERGSLGPKPVRRLVPSGAVYFFQIEKGDPSELIDKLWLRSVCDNEQDRNDGFGLALWGVWDATVKKGD